MTPHPIPSYPHPLPIIHPHPLSLIPYHYQCRPPSNRLSSTSRTSLPRVPLPTCSQGRRPRDHQRGQARILRTLQAGHRGREQDQGTQPAQNRGEVQMGRLEEARKDEQGRCDEEVRGETQQNQSQVEPQSKTLIIPHRSTTANDERGYKIGRGRDGMEYC